MFRSFTIKNFRCFHNFSMEPLERVNLIAGKNNTGKTSLLEALFLHIGSNNPALPLRINAFRGIEQMAIEADEMWGWLFFSKRIEETIELTSLSEDNIRRVLRIFLTEPEKAQLAASGNGSATSSKTIESITTAVGPHDLTLQYEDTGGQSGTSRAFIVSDGVKTERAPLTPSPVGVFLSTRVRFPTEDAERFSKLDAIGRQNEVLTTLSFLEPRLKRLAVLVRGGAPMINGDIGVGELVPLPLMGEGVVRLASIVLAIANAQNGTVLIDEVENGLHYSVMVNVWKAIAFAARQSNTQIFATTHSWECIRAAHEAFSESDIYDFRLHRLDRADSEIRAVTYDQDMLAAADVSDLEVR
ncbi:MAG: ATPase [Anaerolineae bacterium]|nr:AAA family ATPase [Anaerolineales bacterium]MCQ3973082.1 ATPase [Anaerolineae bacterium]